MTAPAYLLPVQERAAVAVTLLLVGQGWPAERAAALVREVVAARSELTARHVAYVPPAEWAKEIQHG